jgi:hypothetical protein
MIITRSGVMWALEYDSQATCRLAASHASGRQITCVKYYYSLDYDNGLIFSSSNDFTLKIW